MRTRTSGGVGGAGVSPAPTRFLTNSFPTIPPMFTSSCPAGVRMAPEKSSAIGGRHGRDLDRRPKSEDSPGRDGSRGRDGALPRRARHRAAGRRRQLRSGRLLLGKIRQRQRRIPAPEPFGVDPVDGSVYIGDEVSSENFRIQKLSPTGTFEASALISKNVEPARLRDLHGIAVDHERGLFYLISGCRAAVETVTPCTSPGGRFAATKILIFKTTPTGTTLEPAPTPVSACPRAPTSSTNRRTSLSTRPTTTS